MYATTLCLCELCCTANKESVELFAHYYRYLFIQPHGALLCFAFKNVPILWNKLETKFHRYRGIYIELRIFNSFCFFFLGWASIKKIYMFHTNKKATLPRWESNWEIKRPTLLLRIYIAREIFLQQQQQPGIITPPV